MATSGSKSISATSHDTLKFSWWRESYSIPNNTTTIGWKMELIADGYGYISSTASKNWSVTVNGTKYSGSNTIGISNNSTKTLASGTTTIKHNDNGSKTFEYSFSQELEITFSGTHIGTKSGNGSGTLDNIPRYAKITSFTVDKRDETSVTFKYATDVTCDYVWYSKDDGKTWSNLPTNKIVTGLISNTSYKFKVRVRRKDSQLTTDSATYTQSTYDYPHCIKSPDFTIGNTHTINIYNPLNRSFEMWIELADGSRRGGGARTGTTVSGFNNQDWKNWLYSSIPNATSGKYKVLIKYGGVTKTRDNGNIYKIKGTEIPTVGSLSYADINDTTKGITGNPQHIVQNQSNLQITYTSATPNYGAGSIKKYAFELNGVTKESITAGGTVNFGKVNSSKNLTLTLTVTDSRGLTAQKKLDITMLAHSIPTAIVTLERLNNYEDETYLKVNALVSSINGKNTRTIKYRYKPSNGDYGSFVTISNNEIKTLNCDKNKLYVFNVVVTDIFGSKHDKEYILDKGAFPLFIDTEKNAVGINGFPTEGEALYVANGVARFVDGIVLKGSTKNFLVTVKDDGTLSITEYK